jgi:hypothetical protein
MRLTELWTHARATRFGFLAGFAALLLWPAHAIAGPAVRPAFVAALAVTAVCGTTQLAMSLIDLLTVRRDRRVLPARIFDLALGIALTLPSGLALLTLLR